MVLDMIKLEVYALLSEEFYAEIKNKWHTIFEHAYCTISFFDKQLGKLAFMALAMHQL